MAMSNEITEVFGCVVQFLDDRKRKYQSHEAHISKRAGVNGVMGSASIDAEGYGATPEEALNNLRLVVAELIGPNTDEVDRLRERELCKADCRKAAEIAVEMYGANAECISTVDECLRIIDERSL